MPVLKSRPIHRPLAGEVLAVLEEVLRFDADEQTLDMTPGELAGGIVDEFMCRRLLESLSFDKWPRAAVRAVVEAIVANAPDRSLRELAAAVRAERKVVRWQTREFNRNYDRVYGGELADLMRVAGGRERLIEQRRGVKVEHDEDDGKRGRRARRAIRARGPSHRGRDRALASVAARARGTVRR